MRLVSQLLMVCDGNYYLLDYNPKSKCKKVRMYRVDRMKDVKRIRGSEREGFAEIGEVDLETYTKTHFGMFEGVLRPVFCETLCQDAKGGFSRHSMRL